MKLNETISGGEALIDILRRQGVEYIFSSPGSDWAPVWEVLSKKQALREPGPQYVNCRHEELAVTMASGYHKMTGRLPAVLLHTTVGTLHGLMALRSAYQEQIPMVVFAGDSISLGEQKDLDPGFQWPRFLADVGGPARAAQSYVKWSCAITSGATLPGLVHRAAQLAMSPPQGPVLLSFPFELMIEEMDPGLMCQPHAVPLPSQADSRGLEEAARLLVQSQNPLIITEHAGQNPEAVDSLVELAELIAAPVVESRQPMYYNFPKNHPLHAGYDATAWLQEADVVFAVATVGPWHPPSAGPGKGRVVVLDDNPLHHQLSYWGYKADLCLAGHVPSSLAALVREVRALVARDRTRRPLLEQRLSAWKAIHEGLRKAWADEALASKDRKPIDARWLCYALNLVLPENATVVEETIMHSLFIRRYVERVQPRGFFGGVFGGLGTGLGQALGAKWASPDRFVVALMGDGSFNYNPVLAALGFAQEYETPILIVLFNNQCYASMKRTHLQFYPDGWAARTGVFYGVRIEPAPAYAALMNVFGGHGETVEDPDEIQPALLKAINAVRQGKTALVDVILEK